MKARWTPFSVEPRPCTVRYAVIPLEGGEPIPLQVPSRAQALGWTSTVPSAPVPTPSALIPGSVATYIDSEKCRHLKLTHSMSLPNCNSSPLFSARGR